MTNAAALLLAHTSSVHATPGEVRTMPDPLADLARGYLEAKRAEKEAKARAEAVEAELLSRLEATGRKDVEVSGLGKVTFTAGSNGTRFDVKAAEITLRALGAAIPMAPAPRSPSLRCAFNV